MTNLQKTKELGMLLYSLNSTEKNILQEFIQNIEYSDSLDKLIHNIIAMQNDVRQQLNKLRNFILTHICIKSCKHVASINNLPCVKNPYLITVFLGILGGKLRKEYENGVWLKIIKNSPQTDLQYNAPSTKDSKEFLLHTDLSYTNNPPQYFLMHCIENPNLGGDTSLCLLDTLLKNLSATTINQLLKSEFKFSAPSYYHGSNQDILNSVLFYQNEELGIRYRRDGILATSRQGIEALAELTFQLSTHQLRHTLEENSAIIINNTRVLHGRFSFLNETEKQKRHYCQVYFD